MKTVLLTVAFVALFAGAGLAETAPIKVSDAWLRATPRGAPVAGGYATVTNIGTVPDRLVGASIPGAAAGEVHSMTMANGVMHMERLAQGLAIAPGATVTLTPDGYHLMFPKPTTQLKVGQEIIGTLTFAKAGAIPVIFEVAGMAAKSAPGTPPPAKGSMPGMQMH